ncbi:hypothetical protein [Burkholderia thailandensis]|uniref:hypothetical protein n=1 Tax=Burkholderia thailandensis TaxID=57975 RepID=UPI002D770D0F|nr:hypothetical protein [Burkholderia thailandensis]WRS70006.1 hypothetical protein U9S59_29895 [Burkholderia thailandensis]
MSLLEFEELLRGVALTCKSIRCWRNRFEAKFARRAKAERDIPGAMWNLDAASSAAPRLVRNDIAARHGR